MKSAYRTKLNAVGSKRAVTTVTSAVMESKLTRSRSRLGLGALTSTISLEARDSKAATRRARIIIKAS